jgi:hypothetical protein
MRADCRSVLTWAMENSCAPQTSEAPALAVNRTNRTDDAPLVLSFAFASSGCHFQRLLSSPSPLHCSLAGRINLQSAVSQGTRRLGRPEGRGAPPRSRCGGPHQPSVSAQARGTTDDTETTHDNARRQWAWKGAHPNDASSHSSPRARCADTVQPSAAEKQDTDTYGTLFNVNCLLTSVMHVKSSSQSRTRLQQAPKDDSQSKCRPIRNRAAEA